MAVNAGMFDCGNFQDFLPLQQSAAYARAAEGSGARVRWLDLGCGTALAVERPWMRLISRGPVWQRGAGPEEQRRALRRQARWAGLTIVTPGTPISGVGFVPLVTPTHHAIWQLGPDLRAGMAGKWRNRLVAAERAGVRVRQGGLMTLEHLIAAEERQRQIRRYRAMPVGFTRALPYRDIWVWDWRDGADLGAAMAFVVHGTTATYHLGWGSNTARRVGAHAVMLIRAAETLVREGVRWLDLGIVDSERAPGLARFKLGTGAVLRGTGATCMVLP